MLSVGSETDELRYLQVRYPGFGCLCDQMRMALESALKLGYVEKQFVIAL